jgi:ATP-binding cassette subfamily B protein RaxB
MAIRAAFRDAQALTGMLDFSLWKRRHVRLIRQTEVAECGLACLAMIAGFYGLDVELGTLRRSFQPSLRGASLKSLMATADRMGLSPRAVKLPLESIFDLHLPAVLHWDMNHYVVLEAVANGKALIHNPEGTSRWISFDAVSLHFSGVALELRPTEDFEPAREKRTLRLFQLWRKVSGLKRALVQTLVLSVVLEAFVLASPYYMQVAIDSALPALDRDLLFILALGFGLFTLINACASLLRSFVLLSAGTSLGYGIATNVARRLFRLPVDWFEKRHIGDVLSRFQSVTPIQQFMTQGAVSALIDGSLAIFTLALMFFYSAALTFVGLTACALYGVARAISFAAQRSAQEDTIITSGREQSTMIESLRGIVTLRLFNRETARHALWQTRLTDATNANIALARVNIWQNTSNTLILGLENVVSIWLAVRFVMAGGFSAGMVFAYMTYKTQFLQRVASLIDQLIAVRMLGLHLERLSDIALADQDRSFCDISSRPNPLRGHIELRNVSFRYGPDDPQILRELDLVVEPGEYVAITGPSGTGKSTLVKILLGLVEPEEGQVLVDGIPLAKFGHKNFHEQIGAVLQHDNLFAGSLIDNIALFDDAPDMEGVLASAKTVLLHDDIAAMPMGYETLVGDMGSTLSGGQRQRLLLARALYRRPRLLIMDEGTSHLDSAREQAINVAVGAMGITRIVIAHRKETIEAAQRVLIMAGGALLQHRRTFKKVL